MYWTEKMASYKKAKGGHLNCHLYLSRYINSTQVELRGGKGQKNLWGGEYFLKAITMLMAILGQEKFYLVADTYYSVRKMYKGVVENAGHVISKAKITAVGYEPAQPKKKRRG